MKGWVTSFQAATEMRAAGFQDPMTLVIWAEKGEVGAKAASATRDGDADALDPIPADFWNWVRKNGSTNWEVGEFSASVIEEREAHGGGLSYVWVLSNVTFNAVDLRRMLQTARSEPPPKKKTVPRGLLLQWWETWPDKNAKVDVIQKEAESAFPNYHVPRDQLRIIRGLRSAGRRRNGGNSADK